MAQKQSTQLQWTIAITHDSEKYDFIVNAGHGTTVHELSLLIERVVRVPVDRQRLIFKGKTIKFDGATSLSQAGLKDKCKIILLGQKVLIISHKPYILYIYI